MYACVLGGRVGVGWKAKGCDRCRKMVKALVQEVNEIWPGASDPSVIP